MHGAWAERFNVAMSIMLMLVASAIKVYPQVLDVQDEHAQYRDYEVHAL